MATRPTYSELLNRIQHINNNIEDTQARISLADNVQELAQLSLELGHYETELMMVEDYIDRVVDRGRE